MSAFQDVRDQQDASGVELSDNVARDYVKYHRGNVVGHEEEGLLMYLACLTGWAYDENTHVNVIGQGPPGSGKSLTKNTVEALFDGRDTYTKTNASDNAILDSQEWDLALVAPMDEYDKVDKPIVEVLKSSNPEDGGYDKDRNVEDSDAIGGYSPVEVGADAIPWVLLYAPSGKKRGINEELEDRALILYFSNNKHTRRGIGRKEWGHENIEPASTGSEYIYDTHGLSAALRQHVRGLPVRSIYDEHDGEEYLASRTGDTLVYTPNWCWYAVEPIYNVDEDYTNRVYGIVHDLVAASALLNRDERNRTMVEVYVDEDSQETREREAVVVGAQDVANVLSCLPTLLSTTHQLTPLKRHLLDAVEATEGITEGEGTTVTKVQSWLNDNDIPHPTRSTLKDRLDSLAEDYYLERYENTAGKNGQADAYEIKVHGALQPPTIEDLQAKADRDGVVLGADDCVDVDPSRPFVDCADPIRDQPFEETVAEFDAQFSGFTHGESDDSESLSMDEAMGGSGDDTRNESSQRGGQASLTDVDEDGTSAPTVDVSFDVEGEPEDPTAVWVLDALREQSDEPIVVSQHADVTDILESPPTDPAHELWQDRPDHREDRVINEQDATRELAEAYASLKRDGYVVESVEDAPPAMIAVHIYET